MPPRTAREWGARACLLPDGALGDARNGQRDVQGHLALAPQDADHTQCLQLTAGGVDGRAAQVRQLTEHHTVLVWHWRAGAGLRRVARGPPRQDDLCGGGTMPRALSIMQGMREKCGTAKNYSQLLTIPH